ncbi:hypothetical protein COHA_010691 [Chlorella ohadii]|uniref:Uncharacterized protein n=1 Tax=Chlorella ohadii TaxID=2649997 RepID=A0AAD5H102_9CHLO|nr:hypothetical protein COHA_010691 [Chlorella ohadii]
MSGLLATTTLRCPAPGRAQALRRPSARRCVIRAAWSSPFDSWAANQPPEQRFRSLFAADCIPANDNPLTVWDARDALEVCGGLWGEKRQDCLSVFGLDAEQVDRYYSAVMSLEQSLTHDTDPEEEASHRGQERC